MPSTGEVAISFALQGYNPQTINVRAEAPPAASYAEAAPPTRMQPNPVYAELTPAVPPRQKKRSPPKKKVAVKKASPSGEPAPPPPPPPTQPQAQPKQGSGGAAYPSNYPWPPPPPPQ